MGENKESTEVLQWVQLGMVLLPQIMNVVMHYKNLSASGVLSESDKELMKLNLRALKLPKWEDI